MYVEWFGIGKIYRKGNYVGGNIIIYIGIKGKWSKRWGLRKEEEILLRFGDDLMGG